MFCLRGEKDKDPVVGEGSPPVVVVEDDDIVTPLPVPGVG